MVIVTYSNSTYECAGAARSEHDIYLYNENWNLTNHISNIYGEEWDYISISGGDWTDPNEVPSEINILSRKIDQMQANIDYCLMLLEE